METRRLTMMEIDLKREKLMGIQKMMEMWRLKERQTDWKMMLW